MGDLLSGGNGGALDLTGGLNTELGFALIFNLIWQLMFAIMQKAALYEELAGYGVDLTKYINTDVNLLGK